MADAATAAANDLAKPTDVKEQAQPEVVTEKTTETEQATQDEEAKQSNGDKPVTTEESKANGEAKADTDSHDKREGGYRGKPKDYSKNVKSDLAGQEESSDPDEIRKQVEFYFSDSNLPLDNFLLSKVGGAKNNPVPLKTIHSFKRMRHFQPYSAVLAALKESTVLDLTDDEQVKRKVPLDEAIGDGQDVRKEGVKIYEDKAQSRSIYAKGFGEETPTTQFDIEAFFAPYGPTNAIRLRRSFNRTFKGSVFVEFDSEATQQAFLALDPKPKWQDQELLIKSKKEYVEGKAADIASGKIKASSEWRGGRGRGRGGPRREGGERDWRERRDEDRSRGYRDDRDKGRRGGHRPHRGGRGGRGRGDRDRGDRGGRDDRNPTVPQIATSTDEKPSTTKDAPSSPSKKRPHDDAGEKQGNEKKVDTKAAEAQS